MRVGWGIECLYSLRVSAAQYLGKRRGKSLKYTGKPDGYHIIQVTLTMMGKIDIISYVMGYSEKSIASLLWYFCQKCLTWVKS